MSILFYVIKGVLCNSSTNLDIKKELAKEDLTSPKN